MCSYIRERRNANGPERHALTRVAFVRMDRDHALATTGCRGFQNDIRHWTGWCVNLRPHRFTRRHIISIGVVTIVDSAEMLDRHAGDSPLHEIGILLLP